MENKNMKDIATDEFQKRNKLKKIFIFNVVIPLLIDVAVLVFCMPNIKSDTVLKIMNFLMIIQPIIIVINYISELINSIKEI